MLRGIENRFRDNILVSGNGRQSPIRSRQEHLGAFLSNTDSYCVETSPDTTHPFNYRYDLSYTD